jgi:benzoyl-CoA reductase subunit C
MSSSADFVQFNHLPHTQLENWKKEGKKVLGYVCSYVPDELIAAAGILPVRIRAQGRADTPMADALMSPTTCSFARCVLEGASRGGYEFLDGLVGCNSCDQARRLFDNLRFKAPFPSHFFLSVPATFNDVTVDWFEHELSKFKDNLQNHFGMPITDIALEKTIDTYNKTRELLTQLYALRKSESPRFSGTEVMNVILASVSLPKEEFNDLLAAMLQDMEACEDKKDYKARIMVVGSHLDDPDFLEMIEDFGGMVVTDYLCFGRRYFNDLVPGGMTPLAALARRYLSRVPCPRMSGGHPQRADFVKEQIKEFNVDGVIIQRMKFCPSWWGEAFMLQKELKEIGVPCLEIEKEYMLSGSGAIRTRIQAFLETLEGR